MHIEHGELLRFLLLFALIIAAAKAGGWLSLRLGQPAVLGEILAGVLLGPSVLNVLGWSLFHEEGLATVVGHLANLGVIFLMFIAGLGTDLAQVRRGGRGAARLPVREGLLASVAVGTLVLSWAAEAFGQVASITGAYLAGVLVAGAGFRAGIEHRMRAFTYAILVPVFFVGIGLQTNARLLAVEDLPFALLVIAAAVVGKVLGSGLGARAGGFTGRESLRIGVGMVSRGEVGLIIAGVGIQNGLLTDRGFAVMVIMVLATP